MDGNGSGGETDSGDAEGAGMPSISAILMCQALDGLECRMKKEK
jgi:hypothetical protein